MYLKATWDELTLTGKLFSWWIIPIYLLTHLVLAIIGVLFYGIYAAWCDKK